jgi:hypothetical protein
MIKKVRPARPQYCLLRPVGRNCLAYPEGEYLCVDARSVLPVREHGKVAKTLLTAFFNISIFEEILVHKKSPTKKAPNHQTVTEGFYFGTTEKLSSQIHQFS